MILNERSEAIENEGIELPHNTATFTPKVGTRSSEKLILKAAASQVDEAIRKLADQDELEPGLLYVFEELRTIQPVLRIGAPDNDALEGLAAVLSVMRRLSPHAPWTDLIESVNSDLKTGAPKRKRFKNGRRAPLQPDLEKAMRAYERVHKVPGAPRFFPDGSILIEAVATRSDNKGTPTARAPRSNRNSTLY